MTPARPAATRPAAVAVAANNSAPTKSDSPSDSLSDSPSDSELTPKTKVLVKTLKMVGKSAVKAEKSAQTALEMSLSQAKTIEHHAEADKERAEADKHRAKAEVHNSATTHNMSETLLHSNQTTLELTKQSSLQQIQLGEKDKYIAELEKKAGVKEGSEKSDENVNPKKDATDAVGSKPATKISAKTLPPRRHAPSARRRRSPVPPRSFGRRSRQPRRRFFTTEYSVPLPSTRRRRWR